MYHKKATGETNDMGLSQDSATADNFCQKYANGSRIKTFIKRGQKETCVISPKVKFSTKWSL